MEPTADNPLDGLSPRVVIGGLLGLIALVYLPTLAYGFVYDDGWTILSNGFLRSPANLGLLLSPESAQTHVPDAFRPTLVAFDLLTYQAVGLHAKAHHAISVGLHLTVCLLLERWLARLGAPLLPRAATLAIFGLMAIHAEVVTVVSFREDLIAAALGFAALNLASRAIRSEGSRAAAFVLPSMLCAALAGGAKASAIMLPIVWVLAELVSPWGKAPSRRAVLLVGGLIGLAGLATLVQTWLVYGSLTPYDPSENARIMASRIGTSSVLAASTRIHVEYLGQMLVPLGLSPEHVDHGASWSEPSVLASSAGLLSLVGAGLWRCRARSAAGLAIVGAAVLAVPTSNLAGMPNMQADRFMYLPSAMVSLGFGLGAIFLGRWLARRFEVPALVLVPLVGLGVLQGAMAQATTSVYASNTTLWRVALTRAPDSARSQAMAGLNAMRQTARREHLDEDVLARAKEHCEAAEHLDPQYELPQICHARLAALRRDWGEAYARFERATQLSPDRNDRSLAALAELSLDLPGLSLEKRRELAFSHIARGLREYPYSPELKTAAARIAHRLGHPWLALHLYRGARRLRPERWETVTAGLELALDLGHAAAARRTWLKSHALIAKAPPEIRGALSAKLADAERLYPAPLLQSLLSAGVFPNDP